MNDSLEVPTRQSSYEAAALVRLRKAKWYAFDLDDTLHSFRKASAAAVRAVLEVIHEKSGRALEELEAEYQRILVQGTVSAFVDGKTSHQYRRGRFQQLVAAYGIKMDKVQMQTIVDSYEKVMTENLELKSGVLVLLQTLKRYGRKVAVITEGPQDAQERTVKALGITPYIDYLATTNKLGVAKIDGLFVKVLEHLRLEPEHMILTGDSWEKDIVPATQVGLYCFHYSEEEPESDESDKRTTIRDLIELQTLVEKAHRDQEA